MDGLPTSRTTIIRRRLNVVAWALAAVLVVTLGRENRGLRAIEERYDRMRAYPYPGQWVPTVRASTINGDTVTVGEAVTGRSQLVFAFTTSCPYCRASLPEWKRLAEMVTGDSGKRHDVYWVSLSPRDSTMQYVAEHGITWPVVLAPDPKMMRVYRVKTVPMTMILTARGQVAYARPGVLGDRAAVDSVLDVLRQINARVAATVDSDSAPRAGSLALPSRR
jgi:peroxiredoxin